MNAFPWRGLACVAGGISAAVAVSFATRSQPPPILDEQYVETRDAEVCEAVATFDMPRQAKSAATGKYVDAWMTRWADVVPHPSGSGRCSVFVYRQMESELRDFIARCDDGSIARPECPALLRAPKRIAKLDASWGVP